MVGVDPRIRESSDDTSGIPVGSACAGARSKSHHVNRMVALEFTDSVTHHGRQTSRHRPGDEHHYRGAVWDLFAHRSVG